MSTASLAQVKQLLELFSGATNVQAQRVIENGDLVRILLTADLKLVDRAAFEALLLADPLDRYTDKLVSAFDWLPVLRRYNAQYWENHFTDEDFAAAEAQLSEIPADHAQAVRGLYGFHVVFGSVAETIEMWMKVFKGELPNAELWETLQFDEKHFRLNDLAETYEPGIHLVWVNLVAHWEPEKGRTIDEVRPIAREAGEKLAQLELLSIWGVLIELFQEQNGTDLPYTDMAGTEITVPGHSASDAWRRVLYVCWGPDDRKGWVYAPWAGRRYRKWSAPVVRKV